MNIGYLLESILKLQIDDEIFIDGEKKETKKAAGYFLSCAIEKGDHEITLKYTVPGIKLGAVISLLSLLTLFGWMIIEHKVFRDKKV